MQHLLARDSKSYVDKNRHPFFALLLAFCRHPAVHINTQMYNVPRSLPVGSGSSRPRGLEPFGQLVAAYP
jgi:hypothetical protein